MKEYIRKGRVIDPNDAEFKQELKKAMDNLPPWPWKKQATLDYIDWSTKLLWGIAEQQPKGDHQ